MNDITKFLSGQLHDDGEAVEQAIEALSKEKEGFKVISSDGSVRVSIRAVARCLKVNESSMRKTIKRLESGAAQNPDPALEMLAMTGIKGAAQNAEITDMQLSCLADYFSRSVKVSDEVRLHNRKLVVAMAAIGVRVLLYRSQGINPDYTPIAKDLHQIDPMSLKQVRRKQAVISDLIEEQLQEMKIPYFRNILYQGAYSISHSDYLRMDFYLPTVGEYGIAIKGYYQEGSGSGYQKLPCFKDEIIYQYPCPGFIVASGAWLVHHHDAKQMISHIGDWTNPHGKFQGLLVADIEGIQSALKSHLIHYLGYDTTAHKFEKLEAQNDFRLFPPGTPPSAMRNRRDSLNKNAA